MTKPGLQLIVFVIDSSASDFEIKIVWSIKCQKTVNNHQQNHSFPGSSVQPCPTNNLKTEIYLIYYHIITFKQCMIVSFAWKITETLFFHELTMDKYGLDKVREDMRFHRDKNTELVILAN